MKFDVKKPVRLSRISQDSWKSLTLKQKDFVMMVSLSKYSKEYIMRKLHVTNNSTYWRIQKKVQDKLKGDIAKRNELYEKALNKQKQG